MVSRGAASPASPLQIQLEAVVGPLDSGRDDELGRAVGEQHAARTGLRGGCERLVDAEVAAGLTVVLAAIERRLADEEIGVACELGEPLARAAVSRVGDRLPVRREPEPIGLEGVVRQPERNDLDSGGREAAARARTPAP